MNTASQSRSGLTSPTQGVSGQELRPLEIAVLAHVAVLLIGASWAFGGGAGWAKTLIAAWGSLSVFLTWTAIRNRRDRGEPVRQSLIWLIPLIGFNVLVLLSCLNPSFSSRTFGGAALLAHTGAPHPLWPSTAVPRDSLAHLWLFDAIYLSCFNLLLAIRRRRALRLLVTIAVANAVVLSVFGTFQALTSDGLYFGAVTAPNTRFFATFVYGNHWAAYLVLLLAAAVGLFFYFSDHPEEIPLAQSPVIVGALTLLLMAITPVLAGSRAGTLMVVAVLAAGMAQYLVRRRRQRDLRRQSTALPVVSLLLCVAIGISAAIYLGRGIAQERFRDTQDQLQSSLWSERLKLYSDTCQLAAEHPIFGWGLGSFDKIFQLIRPRPLAANRQYEHSYVDAHSDWLQAWAEVGIIGTALLLLCGLGPLLGAKALRFASPFPSYLLGGCGLILLYAGVEFPFGNPAVVIAFWVCFFGAIQYVRLSGRAHAVL